MTRDLELTRIGDSLGIVLPNEMLSRLGIGQGDSLRLTETPNGIFLSATDEEFSAQLEIAEQIMREDRDVLRRLAE